MNVLWFSCGVSSAVAAYLCRDELDKIIYCHVDDQHRDSLRFLQDMEALLGRRIDIVQSHYKSVDYACRMEGMIRLPKFAICTQNLKVWWRKMWEMDNPGRHTYYWGMDYGEREREERIVERMPEFDHRFPLVEKELTKQDCHGMIARLGVKRPAMYDLGYQNNNCVGCIKGGRGYWNKIRNDFPVVFESRARLERDIGHSCINGVFLDELDPNAGRDKLMIDMSCFMYCSNALDDDREKKGRKEAERRNEGRDT